MVAEEEAIPEGLGQSIQRLVVYLYTNGILITPKRAGRLQRDSNALTTLFDNVVLRTNVYKTVIMFFQLCHSPEAMSMKASSC